MHDREKENGMILLHDVLANSNIFHKHDNDDDDVPPQTASTAGIVTYLLFGVIRIRSHEWIYDCPINSN